MNRCVFALFLGLSVSPVQAQTFTDGSDSTLSTADKETLVGLIDSFITAMNGRSYSFQLKSIRPSTSYTQGYCGEILIESTQDWRLLHVAFMAGSVRIVAPNDSSDFGKDALMSLYGYGCLAAPP